MKNLNSYRNKILIKGWLLLTTATKYSVMRRPSGGDCCLEKLSLSVVTAKVEPSPSPISSQEPQGETPFTEFSELVVRHEASVSEDQNVTLLKGIICVTFIRTAVGN